MTSPSNHKNPSARERHSGVIGLVVAFFLIVVITGLLHARAALSEKPQAREPLAVEAVTYQQQAGYSREISYLGLIVAGRKARLGFEISGRISSLGLRQGSHVRSGDVMASLDDSALLARRNALAADLEQARAELELAVLKTRRQRELAETGAVSQEAFDETRLRARALQSQVEAVAARLDGVDIELEKSKLVAPYDGVVAERFVHEGAVVNAGTPILRLVESVGKEAHIGVSVAQATELKPGNKYPLKLQGKSLEATLLSVRPDVDPLTRTATAVFSIPPELAQFDGEPVSLLITETVAIPGGWLPMEALTEGARGVWNVLRITDESGTLRTAREAVEALDIQGSRVYVRGTLNSGDRVVASGIHRIIAGNPVSLAGQN